MSSTRQVTRSAAGVVMPPWVTAGYRVRREPSFMERVELAGVKAYDAQAQRLLAFGGEDGAEFVEIISGYPVEPGAGSAKAIVVESERLALPHGFTVTDVQTSALLGSHYLLDARSNAIIIMGPALRNNLEQIRRVPIRLPSRVRLSADSRMAVQSVLPDRPELLDAALFVSAPDARVVLEVNPQDGSATVISTSVGRPTGLAFDGETNRLLIADRDGEIHQLSRSDGTVRVLVTSRPERRAQSVFYSGDIRSPVAVAVYRLESFHWDHARLDHVNVTPGWGRGPALLVVLNADARMAVFALNFENGHLLTQVMPGADRIVMLPSGELLFPSKGAMIHLRHPAVVVKASSQDTLSPPHRS